MADIFQETKSEDQVKELRSPQNPDTSTLIGKQKEAYDGLVAFAEDYGDSRMYVFEGFAGVGKAHPLHSKILTPKGWMLMGELKVGDIVFAEDGTPTTINGVFPQGEKDIYEVELYDGTTVECCGEHLWKVADEKIRSRFATKKRKRLPKEWVTLNDQNEYDWEVKELKAFKDKLVGRGGRNEYCIPYCKPIDLPYRELRLDPYITGVLLGDGSTTTDTVTFTTLDQEIVKNVRLKLPNCFTVSPLPSDKNCYSITSNILTENGGKLRGSGFGKFLRELDLHGKKSFEKVIPEEYLLGSIEQRLELLRGLMDTDGTIDKKGLFNFGSTSKIMCNQVLDLVKSLGGCPSRIREKNTGRHKPYFRFNFKLPHYDPFYVLRKSSRIKKGYVKHNYVIGVKYIGQKSAQCISVEHESKTYITDGYNVTHNTYVLNMFIEDMIFNYGSNICACAPTHKAKVVLKQMAEFKSERHLHYSTVHSLLGLMEHIMPNGDKKFIKDKKKKCKIGDYDFVIVDESSMLEDELFGYLREELDKNFELKIIFVGDRKQLPPVKQSCSMPLNPKVREKLDMGYSGLTQIVRQKGTNPIIKLSKDIRNGKFEPVCDINDEGQGIKVVRSKDYQRVLKAMFTNKSYEENPNFCRVVAWTNACVNEFNDKIRKMIWRDKYDNSVAKLRDKIKSGEINQEDAMLELEVQFPFLKNGRWSGLRLPKYIVGDKLIADEPIFQPECPKTILFHTNEELLIKDTMIDTRTWEGHIYQCYIATVKNLYTNEIDVIEIIHESSQDDFDENLEKIKKLALSIPENQKAKKVKVWKKYYAMKERFAALKYAPALTTYKSQGSTYENIIIIVPDIMKNTKSREVFQHLYVGLTRASKRAFFFV